MPYGFPKAQGGDSKANDALMERCVSRVMATGKDKVTAIKICKTSIAMRKAKTNASNGSR
jgi:ribosomal protein S7